MITLILMLTMAIPLVSLPLADSHDPAYIYPTWCYCVVGNNVIGVGQTQKIIFWVNSVPPTANGQYGDRWQFTVDVMKPDGTNYTLLANFLIPSSRKFIYYVHTQRPRQLYGGNKVSNHCNKSPAQETRCT